MHLNFVPLNFVYTANEKYTITAFALLKHTEQGILFSPGNTAQMSRNKSSLWFLYTGSRSPQSDTMKECFPTGGNMQVVTMSSIPRGRRRETQGKRGGQGMGDIQGSVKTVWSVRGYQTLYQTNNFEDRDSTMDVQDTKYRGLCCIQKVNS